MLLNYGIDELGLQTRVSDQKFISALPAGKLPQDPQDENDIPKGIVKWLVEMLDETNELTGIATISHHGSPEASVNCLNYDE